MKQKEEIDSILNSLDGLQKAGPGDFFFTRVQARLEKEETSLWGRVAGFITKPAVALATLCVICLLNAAALFYEHEASRSGLADQLEQSSDEYNTTVAANTYYDENTEAH